MYRGNFRNGPIPFILVVMALFFIFGLGSFIINLIETLLPLLILLAIVAVAAAIMYGNDKSSPFQQMLRNFFGTNAAERPFWPEQPAKSEDYETLKRRDIADKAVSRAGYRAVDNPDIDLAD